MLSRAFWCLFFVSSINLEVKNIQNSNENSQEWAPPDDLPKIQRSNSQEGFLAPSNSSVGFAIAPISVTPENPTVVQTSSPFRWRQGQFGSQWLRGGMARKFHETNSLAPEKCGGGLAKAIDNFVTIFIIDYSYCYSFCLFFLLRISSAQICCFEYLLLRLLQSNFKFQQQASG